MKAGFLLILGQIPREKDDRLCLCCSSFAGQACEAKDSVFDGDKPAGIFAWVRSPRKNQVWQLLHFANVCDPLCSKISTTS